MTWARKVFVSEEMAAEWWTRTDDGRRLTVEWGEPDDEGFYTPTLTATDDGWLNREDAALGAAWRRAKAAVARLYPTDSCVLSGRDGYGSWWAFPSEHPFEATPADTETASLNALSDLLEARP